MEGKKTPNPCVLVAKLSTIMVAQFDLAHFSMDTPDSNNTYIGEATLLFGPNESLQQWSHPSSPLEL